MNVLIAGGSGFVGQALVKHLLSANNKIHQYNITILGRDVVNNTKKFNKILSNSNNLNFIAWSQLESDTSEKLTAALEIITKYDVIINLCGASIGERRWSEKYKQEIISSRVVPTRVLAHLCVAAKQKYQKDIGLYNTSAIGIYGLENKQAVYTESSHLNNSTDFLSKVGRVWEQAAEEAVQNDIRVTFMRFGVVLDWARGALQKMLLPFKLGLGGKIGSGKQAFSWISLADLVRIIEILINNKQVSGPINLVVPDVTNQQLFSEQLAKSMNRPCFMTTPSFLIRLLFGQMGQELLLDGQSVKSVKLDSYYTQWLHPSLKSFLQTNKR